jgi:hypothetical protein
MERRLETTVRRVGTNEAELIAIVDWDSQDEELMSKMNAGHATRSRARTWAVPFESRSWHGLLAWPKAWHDTKYFRSCWHDMNTRAVPCLESRHCGLHGPTRILGRAWANTARKWHVDTSITIQYNFLATILPLI